MRKPLVWLGIALGILAICSLLLTAGAAVGGLIGYLGSRYAALEAPGEPQEAPAPPSETWPEPRERWWPWPTQPRELAPALGGILRPVVVTQVVTGGPAEDARIEPEDVIIAVDGKALDPEHELSQLVRAHEPGDEILLTFLRMNDGIDVLQVEVTLERNTDEQGQVVAYLGIFYHELQPNMRFAPPSGGSRD